MRKSVAVLDIRSSEITSVVGERGVNGTFIIKSKYSCNYDGYFEGNLLDKESFLKAVRDVVGSALASLKSIKTFYVGVPGEFLKVVSAEKTLSFNNAKKITRGDCDTLAAMSAPEQIEDYSVIKHAALYYVLSDKRKLVNPIGSVSDSLYGKFSFYFCNETFASCVMEAFSEFKAIQTVAFLPTVQCEATYLVEPERRDNYAVLLDLGYISSDFSVVCGNGLAYSRSFSVGVGHVAYKLTEEFDIPFEVASRFASMVNLNAKERVDSYEEVLFKGKSYKFTTAALRNAIREALDGVCEMIETCIQNFRGVSLEGKPLLITGEGAKAVKGAAEHISGRLVKSVEIITPPLPYYDKPEFSSIFSLLDAALTDAAASGFLFGRF